MVEVKIQRTAANKDSEHETKCKVEGQALECALEVTLAILAMCRSLPRELAHAVLLTSVENICKTE